MRYKIQDMEVMRRKELDLCCTTTYPFYHKRVKKYEPVVDELSSLLDDKHEKAVLWFVSNAMRAYRNNALGMKVGLNPKHYKESKMGIGWRGVKALLYKLEARGYINIYAGYIEEWKVEKGVRVPDRVVNSCVVFRGRLDKLCISANDIELGAKLWQTTEHKSSIIIRDRKTKEDISTRGKNGVVEQRERMTVINDNLKQSNIKFNGKPIAAVAYKRVYLEDMNIAGRLYAEGGGVQVLSQRLRNEYLTIDDESVVELDYHAIHPSICYQHLYEDGVNIYDVFGKDFSPYGADISFVNVDQEVIDAQSVKLGKKYDPLRTLVKMALMIGINAIDEQSAVGAMSSELYQDTKRDDRRFIGLVGSVPVKSILTAVRKHNDLISEAFFSDKGVYLQKVDSDIMMLIVEKMLQKGYSVLCYHDSAIVKKSAEGDLYQAMFEAWKDILGDTTFCKIDKK